MNDFDYISELKENKLSTPYIKVDLNTGKIIGHDGRHRMRALEMDGIQSAPVVIQFYDGKKIVKYMNGYNVPLTTMQSFNLTSQYNTEHTASVENLIPIMPTTRDEIVAAYGQEDSAIRFSDRNKNATDARTLLSNALLTAAQSDLEREKLEAYQAKIEAMNAEQQKLTDLRAQIRELSFAKGPRDTAKLKALREEATKTANRMTNYDRQQAELQRCVYFCMR